MGNEIIVRGTTSPTVTYNANQTSRKPRIDEDQWKAFMVVCGDRYGSEETEERLGLRFLDMR